MIILLLIFPLFLAGQVNVFVQPVQGQIGRPYYLGGGIGGDLYFTIPGEKLNPDAQVGGGVVFISDKLEQARPTLYLKAGLLFNRYQKWGIETHLTFWDGEYRLLDGIMPRLTLFPTIYFDRLFVAIGITSTTRLLLRVGTTL